VHHHVILIDAVAFIIIHPPRKSTAGYTIFFDICTIFLFFFSFEKWLTEENPPWRLERMVAPQ
jgi:hypothetical protein